MDAVPEPLPPAFFARDADVVARALLGQVLVHRSPSGLASGRIVETEAYLGPPGVHGHLRDRPDLDPALARRLAEEGDPASHAFRGPTPRNGSMFQEPGTAYVYRIYGVHRCLNVSTGATGRPEAVLLRAVEPLQGLELQRARRGRERPQDLGSGPAKLTEALGIGLEHDGTSLTHEPLWIGAGPPPERVASCRRVGVAGGEDLPLRFLDAASPHVSRPP